MSVKTIIKIRDNLKNLNIVKRRNMNKEKLFKIIVSVIFIPFILFFSLGSICYIGKNSSDLTILIILDLITILTYRAIINRLSNVDKQKKEQNKKEQNLEQDGYQKFYDNLFINREKKKLIINNYKYEFSEMISAKLVIDEVTKGIITGMGKNYNSFGTMIGVKTDEKIVKRIDIEIKTTNMNTPFMILPFLKLGGRTGIVKSNEKYRQAYLQAQECLSRFELIIQQNKTTKDKIQ